MLVVRTVRVDDPGDLIEWLEPLNPTAFLRNGDGIVGFGERTGFVAHQRTDRIPALAEWWRELSAAATIDDEVKLPGTGLVAFGSLAFSDSSAEASVMSVPVVVVGRRNGVSWITTIDGGMPVSPTPLGPELADQLGPGSHSPLVPGTMSPEAYRDAVAAVTRKIAAGEARKVVLARDLVGSIPTMSDRRRVISRLAAAYPDTFTFAVNGLVGSSPETLVRVEDGDVSARVLAGTARRWPDDATDAHAASTLAASPKNRAEHEHAVQSVLETMAPHTTGITHNPEPFPLRLPNLWHLATDVRADLVPGRTVLDLLEALHPTAAVAGTPTDAAIALIAKHEPFDRGRYAGPVGWVDADGDGEWAIALRCARIAEDGSVTAWAGAGIVADSDPEKELAETELKFRPIRDALA